MKRRALFIFFIACILVNCREPHSQSSNNTDTLTESLNTSATRKADTNQATIIIKKADSIENSHPTCLDMLTSLIKTSSLDASLQKLNYNARVDQVNNGVVTIELTIKNTERNDDVPLRWLELDSNKNELRDVTIDPDKPIQLKYDTSLFKKITTHCEWQ
jgi:hypothetical protein